MLEAVREHGYSGTTISELAARASVSKSTFYRHFPTKEACFLATLDGIVDMVSRGTGEAYRRAEGGDIRQGLLAAATEFLRLIVEQPDAARFVLIDSLELGIAAVPNLERASRHFEGMARRSFERAKEQGTVSDLEIRAITGGMRRVVYQKLRKNAPEEIEHEKEPLLEWSLSYLRPRREPNAAQSPDSDQRMGLEPGEAQALPWDTPPNSREARRSLSQRERILRATAIAATTHGYAALSIPAITSTAGVSNQTFYEHFDSKQAAFLTAFEELEQASVSTASRAFQAADSWTEGVEAGLRALAENVAANPIHARLAFFELLAAGPEALNRADSAMDNYTIFLRPEYVPQETPRQPPPIVIDAIGGGIWSIMQHEVSEGRGGSIPELVLQLLDIVLIPFGLDDSAAVRSSNQ